MRVLGEKGKAILDSSLRPDVERVGPGRALAVAAIVKSDWLGEGGAGAECQAKQGDVYGDRQNAGGEAADGRDVLLATARGLGEDEREDLKG